VRIPDSAFEVAAGIGRAFSTLAGDSRELAGPEAGFWNRVRRAVFPAVDRAAGDSARIVRPAKERRLAGTARTRPEQVEETLWSVGFRRNPMSAVKERDGDLELGSWVLRDGSNPHRQIHAILFPAREGEGVDVYAHEEPSSVHPDEAIDHYCGADVDDELGVTHLRAVLPLERPDRDRVLEPDEHESGVDDPVCDRTRGDDGRSDEAAERLIDQLGLETPDRSFGPGDRATDANRGVNAGD